MADRGLPPLVEAAIKEVLDDGGFHLEKWNISGTDETREIHLFWERKDDTQKDEEMQTDNADKLDEDSQDQKTVHDGSSRKDEDHAAIRSQTSESAVDQDTSQTLGGQRQAGSAGTSQRMRIFDPDPEYRNVKAMCSCRIQGLMEQRKYPLAIQRYLGLLKMARVEPTASAFQSNVSELLRKTLNEDKSEGSMSECNETVKTDETFLLSKSDSTSDDSSFIKRQEITYRLWKVC